MTYIPTKEEIEEIKAEWFSPEWNEGNHSTSEGVFEIRIPNSDLYINFYPDYIDNIDSFGYAIIEGGHGEDMRFTIFDGYDDICNIYPKSISDIENLIKMFTPE